MGKLGGTSDMHFYTTEGLPMHRIVGANGKERDTNLRDAKKLGLFPSVSTIMSVASEEAIVNWTCEQIINAAWLHPYTGGDIKEWKKEVRRLSKIKKEKAANEGTKIHKAMEYHFTEEYKGYSKEYHDICHAARQFLYDYFGDVDWVSELTFANDGYGGCVDLITSYDKGIIIDFKTQATNDSKSFRFYNKYCMQLAAYRYGLGLSKADCYIMKISSTAPGVFKLKKYSEEELQRQFKCFTHLKNYYYMYNKLERK